MHIVLEAPWLQALTGAILRCIIISKLVIFPVKSSPRTYIFSVLPIRQFSCMLLFPYLEVSCLVKHQNVHFNTRKTGESPIDVAGKTRFSVIFINKNQNWRISHQFH